MDRSEELLQLVLEYTNLSDKTDKLHNRDSLSGYDNSELNCLDAIGCLEQPNVTALAGEMRMTKGAISKIRTRARWSRISSARTGRRSFTG